MDGLGLGPSSALDSTYGAMLIGLLFATFFQGLLTVQTYNYYENYPRDPLRNKVTVGLVWCLDTIHLVLIAQSAYHYLVTNWGYEPALIRSSWEICVQLTFIALSSFVCQIFFLNRIWIFSRGSYLIVGSILAVCLTTLALDILVTVQIIEVPFVTEFGARKAEIVAVFTSGAAADVLIAAFLCYYIQRDQTGFENTRSLIGKILQYVIATGLATSALAIAAIVAYFSRPNGFYFIAIHFNLGRFYTNALLATLNARQKMRNQLQTQQKSSMGGQESAVRVTAGPTKYVSPFPNESKAASPELDNGSSFTYTIERITNRDDNDIEMGKVQGKTHFARA